METSRSLDGRGIGWRSHPLSDVMVSRKIPELEWEPLILPPSPLHPESLVQFALHDGNFSISCRNSLLPFAHRCLVIQFDHFGESEGNPVEYEATQMFSFNGEGVCTPEIDLNSRCEIAVAVALTSGCWLLDSRPFAEYLRVQFRPAQDKVFHLREALRRSALCSPSIDQPFWEWDPPAQKRLTAMARRMCHFLGVHPKQAIEMLERDPSQPFRALVAIVLGCSPDAAMEISASHPDIRSFFHHHWPAMEEEIPGLTPQQIMDLWPVEPSRRSAVAVWMDRKPKARAATADRFLSARHALARLSRDIPSNAQSRLGLDLGALEKAINRAPETSQDECEKLQGRWAEVEALLLREYGFDIHEQASPGGLDRLRPGTIALRELEVGIKWWVSVLSDRSLPEEKEQFSPVDGKPVALRVREGCTMLRRLIEHFQLLKIPERPAADKPGQKAGVGRDAILERLETALSGLRQAAATARRAAVQTAIDWVSLEKCIERLEALKESIAVHCARTDLFEKT